MIVKMKKITFLGLALEKERFLARLQEVGAVHLILPRDMVEAGEIARELVKVVDARKFLARQKPSSPSAAGMDWETICSRREEFAQQEQRLAVEIASLKKDRGAILPFGNFQIDDIAFLEKKNLTIRFYRASRSIYERLDFGELRHLVLSETTGEVAFVTMNLCEDRLPLVEEKLPGRTLGQIEEALAQREADLAKIQAEYAEMAAHIETLVSAENKLVDDLALGRAILNTQGELDERLFVLAVWSPLPKDDLLRRIGSDYSVLSIAEDADPSEQIPVLLRNQAPADAGEDLVKIYSFPNQKDFDPSALVLYSFCVFYGMIIGDAGYGFLFLLLSLYLHWKVKNQSPMWIRMRRMSYMLSGSVIFFGLITASYFGINLAEDHFAKKIMLMNFGTPEGQNFAMKVSIIMGIAHLSIAMAIKFFRTRDLPSVGWILVGWAGFFLINSKMGKGVDNPVAMWIMIAGFVLIVLFTSSSKNPIIRFLAGLNGCLGIMQLFSDVLSYMRLFALGLATMYMCQTFNMLGEMTRQSVPYVGIVLAIPVLVFGHGLNMVLGVMGGVVHGLRLNFLEWYRWCFEGDGLPFKPFQRIGK